MRNYDLSPLYRATVGFDRMADLLDRVMTQDTAASTYPPYNIEKTAEDAYRISIAVAGFTEAELSVEQRETELVIAARKAKDEQPRTFLHRGIATRAFEKRFQLADHVRVTGATHENGMLHVDLVREVPEALKPRQIEITSSRPAAIEAEKAADTETA
ncbi:Hsp20 family protein [Maritalea mobilis]|uniref:Hsp20 family protein n=1 Tax=[Roseibacterium] beibuensis TaxID=1193142 RepID=A0ABP9LC49_9RHOB|nr:MULTISPECIES: Hsp20 family protein [Alphaproteobacteria]MBY6202079.1 Hsp20 family protein [Maritalea mobilis]MCS6624313.1 Hsp20 family protein [Roseibacterium beibuensis]